MSLSVRSRWWPIFAVVLTGATVMAALTAPVLGQDGEDQQERRLSAALRALWDDDSPENRVSQRRMIIEYSLGNPDLVERVFRHGPTFPADAQKGAPFVLSFPGRTGSAEKAGVYVPNGYKPDARHPLIIFLHAGASTTETDRGPRAVEQWVQFCEQNNYLLLAPSAHRGSAWWDLNGLFNVTRALKLLKSNYNIDENKVFLMGFSDGAAGVMYILSHFASPFAGGISLSGHPAIAGGEQAYGQFSFHNLAQRPLLMFNAERDPLYPAAQLEPFLESMKQARQKVEFHAVSAAGHDMSYVPAQLGHIKRFIDGNRRAGNPARVVWEWDGTAALNRNAWLQLTEVGRPMDGEPHFTDINTQLTRTALGVEPDRSFRGPGVKVARVQADTAAEFAGVFPGDRIVKVDDTDIMNFRDLEATVAGVQSGHLTHMWVEREGEGQIELIVEFPPARRVFSRRNAMGIAVAEIDSASNTVNIQSRGVKRLRVLISRALLDVNRPIIVVVNGVRVHSEKILTDTQFMINNHAGDRDRDMIYVNVIDVIVPPPATGSDW